jgi:hypothetical protein
VRDLAEQLASAVSLLESVDARFALIGGMALVAHKCPRATADIDFLLDLDDAPKVSAALLEAGFESIHSSVDAGNFVRNGERIDFIFAHRARSLALIETALHGNIGPIKFPLVTIEGIVGLKLQALANNPKRLQDLVDIQVLIDSNLSKLNRDQVRDYFQLFQRMDLYDTLIENR